MCNKKLYVPTLMQKINLRHRGHLSEIFESRWIVFGNPGHDEKKSYKDCLVDTDILYTITKLVNKTVSNSCPSIFISDTCFEG